MVAAPVVDCAAEGVELAGVVVDGADSIVGGIGLAAKTFLGISE